MKSITISRSDTGKKMMWAAILWIAIVMMTVATVRADIYTWKDEQGVIHFSNQDVPDHADFYMREPIPDPEDARISEQPAEEMKSEVNRRQIQTEVRLEEANRKLSRALEKVDDLTERVSDSQAQAAAAAQAARQAAADAELQLEEAAEYQPPPVQERVVVYAAPYPHRYKRHGIRNHKGHGYNKRPYTRHKPDRLNKHRYKKYNRHMYKDQYGNKRYEAHRSAPGNLHKTKAHRSGNYGSRHSTKHSIRSGWYGPSHSIRLR